jgi:hypothetical protein
MLSGLSRSTKLAALALVGVAIGIWAQALSGAPDHRAGKPLVLDPIAGTLLSLLILAGAFVTPGTAKRLSDPVLVGQFIGTAIQMLALGA